MEASRQSHFDSEVPLELHRRASHVARQAKLLYFFRAGLWWGAVCIGLTLAFMTIDYVLHVDELGLRWLFSVVWIGLIGAAAIWLFGSALAFRLNAVQLADWVERANPQYRGRLSAALAIMELPQGDQRYGSIALRDMALSRLNLAELNTAWERALSFRSTVVAAVGLLVSGLGLLSMVCYQPQQTTLGFERLTQPWAAIPWPRSDELQFVDLPKVIATGSELPIVVVDRKPPLPESVSLQVRYPSSAAVATATAEATVRVREIPLRLASEVAIGTWSETEKSFEIRAIGGDDRNSAWKKIQVADLPQLSEGRFQVQPPAYTGQPVSELVGERIEVLAGSRVTFTGVYSEQVQAVQALVRKVSGIDKQTGGEISASPASGPVPSASRMEDMVAAIVSEDGRSFRLFADDSSGSLMSSDLQWQLRVTTHAGLEMTAPTQWSIHVVPDRAPLVTLFPADPPWLTSDSRLLISGQASDDLELVELQLKWQLQGPQDSAWQAIRLWTSMEPEAAPGAEFSAVVVDGKALRAMNLSYPWSLAAQQLPVGAAITYVLEARDSLGQVSRSLPQNLQVQDARSVLAQAEQEQARIQAPLQQLAQSQRRNADSLDKLSDIVHRTGQLEAPQVETLSAARQLQQSIGQKLSDSTGSMLKKLQLLEEQLDRSGLGETELATDLRERISELETLNSGALSPAGQELSATENLWRDLLKGTPTAPATDAALASVDATASRQRQAADQLAHLVRDVATATTTAELHRQVTELAVRQREIQAATEQYQLERLAASNTPQQQGTQVGLRADQQNLARSLDEVGSRIDQLLEQSTTENDRDATALKRLRQSMLEQQVGQQMRDAADALQDDKLSEAIRHQRTATQALEQAADQFSGSDSGQLADQSGNLAQLASQLGALADQQSDLGDQSQELSKETSAAVQEKQLQRLESAQAQALEQMQQLAEQGEVQANHKLQQLVQAAGEAARTAQQQLHEQQFEQAEAKQRESAEQLKQAEQLTQQRAQALKQQVAQQQLYDLRAALEELSRQQQGNVERLERLASEQPADPARIADWEKSMAQAAVGQQATSQKLETVLDQANAVETFAWVLGRALSDMQRTVAALQRQRVKPDAVHSANQALRKLQAVALASQEAASDSADSATTESTDAETNAKDAAASQNGDKRSQPGSILASLRLIREMQADVREQTLALNGQSTPEAQALLLRLAEEQAALAEQTSKLTRLMVE